MFRKFPIIFNIIIPIIGAIGLLYYYKGSTRKGTDIGLGEGTLCYTPSIDHYPIHIMSPAGIDSMKAGYQRRGSKPVILWIGNSQLHGVNQYKPGQSNSVEFLFHQLEVTNREVLGMSYPNANLQELLMSAVYFSKKMPVKAILAPVFYDDMRETGVRNELHDQSMLDRISKERAYFNNLKEVNKLLADSNTSHTASNDYNGIRETLQDRSERYLNNKFDEHWVIWNSRADFRARLFNDLYITRNMLLGIKPNSVRKMIPGNYQDNYEAYRNLLRYCREKGIQLLIYIPPIRNDVAIPYDLNAYTTFKEQVKADCLASGATFLNIENLIDNKYWGMKKSTGSFNGKGEVDFMHFQERGHQLIADTIFKTIANW